MAKGKENFLKAFMSLKESIGNSRDVDAGRCWVSLKNYLETCESFAIKSAGIVIKMTFAGYDSEAIGKRLGVTTRTIDAYKYDISVDLWRFLGDDFISLFDNFKSNRSEVILRIQNLKNMGISPSRLIDMGMYILPEAGSGDVSGLSLEDCIEELRFLHRHCFATLEREKSRLSPNKMNYVLKVISGEIGTAAERSKALGMLSPIVDSTKEGGSGNESFWQTAGL